MRDRSRADRDLTALVLVRRSRLRRARSGHRLAVWLTAAALVLVAVVAGAAAGGRSLLLGSCTLNALQPVALQLTQLQEFFDDTIAALGSDLFSEALAAYAYMKAAGSGQGLDDLKALLSQRFARRGASTAPAPTPA